MSAEAPTAPGYDRDAIVTSITCYYELLSKMVAIKPKDIAYAPEGGRTDDDIPIEKLRRLGLKDREIDFIRHVPVVCSVDRPVLEGTQPLVFSHYVFNQYKDDRYLLDDPSWAEMWPIPEERIPEGLVPLSHPLQGDPYGTWWLLDTNNGELTAYDGFMNRPDEEVPENEQWRSTRPVPATTYFNGLYEDLKSLNLLPMPLNPYLGVWEIWPAHGHTNGFQRWADEAREVYLQCHWPDLQRFRRAECRKLLGEVMERRKAWESEEYDKRNRTRVDCADALGNANPSPES